MGNRTLPTLDLRRNYARIKEEILEAVHRVLESQMFILGPEVEAFEEEAAGYLEVPYAIGCASGTDSLILALLSLHIGPGDEVITTPYTFFASTSCITRVGARPVFVDVDPGTYNMRMDQVLGAVTPRTKAVIPVHLFGQMCPLEEIRQPLEEAGIALIEDAAQAFGTWREMEGGIRRAGTVGDIGCFSFFPTKNLGCYGDGGMLCTSDPTLAERARSLRVHGAAKTYFHEEVGINSRLDALQAAILRVRLRHLEEWNEERRLAADRYQLLFAEKGLEGRILPPVELEGNHHIYHQYVVKAVNRDALQHFLDEEGISSRIYYPLPLHLQHCFGNLGYSKGDFLAAEALSEQTLALPIFPEITPEEQEWVVSSIAKFYKR